MDCGSEEQFEEYGSTSSEFGGEENVIVAETDAFCADENSFHLAGSGLKVSGVWKDSGGILTGVKAGIYTSFLGNPPPKI